MRISIITVAYNSSDTIREAIESILAQTFSDIEYIIIDGQSRDNTVAIIKEYACRLGNRMRWISEPDSGIYDALNKGIRMATGDIVGFLHSDDVFSSVNVLSRIHHVFETYHADVVYGDLVYVKHSNLTKAIRYWESKEFTDALLQRGWMPPHPTVFVRREVYQHNGLYDPKLQISADYDFLLRIFKNEKLRMVYLSTLIVKMRSGGISNRNLPNIVQKMREDYQSLQRNQIFCPMLALFLKNVTKLRQFIIRKNI
ncbi:glycosyltransferase family 2 protein [Microbacter margulisiae]|uniref:Glycosyltransferase n=1 Tax=Microbacter margulisiae TaxID=1350067 RepID=A0A7W5H1Y9_9PORP|nr:glycosyltransferase family 2 protein [Microbacter margulisiae]MBB3187175.1 glycosyltransferase [Microbacter margulisiae]